MMMNAIRTTLFLIFISIALIYGHNLESNCNIERLLSFHPLGHAYSYANNDPVNGVDPTGRAFYGFEGTHYPKPDGSQTVVQQLVENYAGVNAHYFSGVGSPNEGKVEGMTGLGVTSIANAAYNQIVQNYNNGDTVINMAAWSRGNVSMMQAADRIYKEGIPDLSAGTKIEVSYAAYPGGVSNIKIVPNAYLVPPYSNEKIITQMHMIDPVYAMGLPYGDIDIGYTKTIPPNVNESFVYIANNKTPINSVKSFFIAPGVNNQTIPQGIDNFIYFNGNHADLGGAGNTNVKSQVYNTINSNSYGMFNHVPERFYGGANMGK
ncbi:MAG: hypothetical protein NZM04_08130 [Methylacidiphilales bacterium]|nr:hypothetical protein [Candidatus Methylacidiphilales bacterium]